MQARRSLQPTLVWAILISATLVSLAAGHAAHSSHGARAATLAVIAMAYLKGRFIILDFMEMRDSWLPLRLMLEAWLVLVCGFVVGLYMRGA